MQYPQYYDNQEPVGLVFIMEGDVFRNNNQKTAYEEISQARNDLFRHFKALINYIKMNYIEVDLNLLSEIAHQRYIDHIKDFNERFPQ